MILVVIHRTEYLDHLASAVMIAIGCATVAVILANHPTDQGRATHTGAKVEFLSKIRFGTFLNKTSDFEF